MDLKNFFKIFLIHLSGFLAGTFLFMFLLWANFLKGIEIFFYRGIALIFVSSLIMLLIFLALKQKVFGRLFTYRDIILSLVLIFSFNLIFFTHVPVTVDRAVSVFLLGRLNESPHTKQEITQELIDKYLIDYGGVDKRLREQQVSGNIVQIDDKYQITEQGRFIVKIFSVVTKIFRIDNKNIFPL